LWPQLQKKKAKQTAAREADGEGGGESRSEGGSESSEVPLSVVHPDYSVEAANLGIVLVLGLTYSVIAPAIMPICMAFFAMAFLVYCWLFSFVYTPEFDCVGECWEVLAGAAMLGLQLGSLSLAALASAFVGFDSWEFYALVALCGLVVGASVYFKRAFAEPSRYMPLEDAVALDRDSDAALLAEFREDYYIDPIIKGSDSQTGPAEAPSSSGGPPSSLDARDGSADGLETEGQASEALGGLDADDGGGRSAEGATRADPRGKAKAKAGGGWMPALRGSHLLFCLWPTGDCVPRPGGPPKGRPPEGRDFERGFVGPAVH